MNMIDKQHKAIVLFGHGARDERWAEPFMALKKIIESRLPEGTEVALAFLELMTPSLPQCLDTLAQNHVGHVTVVPVFFGVGGHLRKDFPALLDQCRHRHPDLTIETTPAVGEWAQVQHAIAIEVTNLIG